MTKEKESSQTPLMRQYYTIKAKHPDAILLFRVGDFYETFSEDAIKASEILGITLTKRAGTELAGVPYHAIDSYLPKLVRAGLRVAICEQLEDPKMVKGLVKRGITELVTPGVVMSDRVLENRENNFLASVDLRQPALIGVAFLDISTGEFLIAEGDADYVDRLLATFKPKEILFEKGYRQLFQEKFGPRWVTYAFEDWAFQPDAARERLLRQFQVHSLKGFGVENLIAGTTAAGAIMHYLDVTQHDRTNHIQRLSRIEEEQFVWLDRFTIRNLELFASGVDGTTSLTDVIDHTVTPMGSRMLKRWVAMPLKSKGAIEARNTTVSTLIKWQVLNENLKSALHVVGDLERLVSKIATARISPREMVQLQKSLTAIETLKKAMLDDNGVADCHRLRTLAEQFNPCEVMRDRIAREILAEPNVSIAKGGVIAQGVNEELDDLRMMSGNGRAYLNDMQIRLSEQTNIPSLKISFNNVFGYYIEVRNTHKDKVPEDWIRKQTLAQAERYITPELKEYEDKILTAEERILAIEAEIFNRIILDLQPYIAQIQADAAILSELDVLQSFAGIATEYDYHCPEILDSDELDIVEGRHPVIERLLPEGEPYISNSLHVDTNEQQIIIVTGPNMAGKSALLRQTALIVLMAQIGSFVPAKEARIGIVDKIFTRVGASDNISAGESTFMVEMTEAANILNNVTPRSLVLFDELGRGTSTYDGISLAWSIVEYLHSVPSAQAKTLFATHYHELNEMERQFSRIKNYNVSVKEINGKVIFMRKLARGGSAHSFGIHVAKLAGMPRQVVARAQQVLEQLEAQRNDANMKAKSDDSKNNSPSCNKLSGDNIETGYQMSIFQLDDPVLKQVRDEIAGIDINNLTPLEALNKLNEIKKVCGVK
ncbi:MAG: DNA mismatch repair protein MutS [Marinilabiliaceae bacterium]|nr:DNA mismatch repair protein MutS [Marinilabiliaceae bacterium]